MMKSPQQEASLTPRAGGVVRGGGSGAARVSPLPAKVCASDSEDELALGQLSDRIVPASQRGLPHPRCADVPRTAVGVQEELAHHHAVRQGSSLLKGSAWGLTRHAVIKLVLSDGWLPTYCSDD